MRKAAILALMASLWLPGCAGVVVADASRKETRAAIAKVMAEERPGVDSAEAAICVQKAMTMVETVQLGTANNYRAVSPANRARIAEYIARPEAQACLGALPAMEAAS